MNRTLLQQLLTAAVAVCVTAAAFAQTKVYVLPTLHGLHQTNRLYNYDSVKAVVHQLQPDVIAVEIRSEDIGSDTAYLQQNYPYEMWMMRYWFPQATIAGFDWLGSELEGRPIPQRYWSNQSRIKALQRLLHADTAYTTRLKSCDLYTTGRLKILKTAALKDILRSNDALLIREYYHCLNQHLRGSAYEELVQFYAARDRRLQQNVQKLIEANPNKTIVVLTGDDHYPYLIDYLNRCGIATGQAELMR